MRHPLLRSLPMLCLAVAGVLPGCGLDPSKISPHALLADDGGRVVFPGPVRFAVVGNTAGSALAIQMVYDITKAAAVEGGPAFAVLMGDHVTASSNSAWKDFDQVFTPLLSRPGGAGPGPVPAVPVAGPGEGAGDPAYRGWAAAFPEVGADIGFNRVASWYSFDIKSGETEWRFVIIDADKARLGSRWNEQTRWLEGALEGDYAGLVVFLHDAPFTLAGPKPTAERAVIPGELLELIDAHIDETRLKAVFHAGANVNEALLPDGAYGPLHIGAGGGGMPAADLFVTTAPVDGIEPLSLEPSFEVDMLDAVNRWNEHAPLAEDIIDAAKARGAHEGLPARISGEAVPSYGWWEVVLDGPQISAQLHLMSPDGAFVPGFAATSKPGSPWTSRP